MAIRVLSVVFAAMLVSACSSGSSSPDDAVADSSADVRADLGQPDSDDFDLGDDLADPDSANDANDVNTPDLVPDVPDPLDHKEVLDNSEDSDDQETPDVTFEIETDAEIVVLPCDDPVANDCIGYALDINNECVPVSVSGVTCDDGDDCTSADLCVQGTCVGTPYSCNDNNVCTDDYCLGDGECTTTFNDSLCDDNDACTVQDTCALGYCVGTPADCECQQDADCLALEDGNLCNGTLVCDKSTVPHKCIVDSATVKTCEPPTGPHSDCLNPWCNPETGQCELVSANDYGFCDDGLFCSASSICENGLCTSLIWACADNSVCTSDFCDEVNDICTYEHADGPCFDGNFCTINDICVSSECKGQGPATCNDNNICTDDSCDPDSGCQYEANSDPCDDEDKCTDGDVCVDKECTSGEPIDCNDNVDCTIDSCSPISGCFSVVDNTLCQDQDACSVGEFCTETGCDLVATASCAAPSQIVAAQCDPDYGCQFTVSTSCGNGTANEAEECDDSNLEPGDGCNPECRTEDKSIYESNWPYDYDVDGKGGVVTVGFNTLDGATFQCISADGSILKDRTSWVTSPEGTITSSEPPRVARAKGTGVTLLAWQHLVTQGDYVSRRIDVRTLDADCNYLSDVIRLVDANVGEFWDMDINDNGLAAIVYSYGTSGYLTVINYNGDRVKDNMALPGALCGQGLHVALSPIGNGGVVSCQGNAISEGVVYWTFDARGELTSGAQPVPGAEGHTAWFDSHNVYMANGGEFVIVNSDTSTSEVTGAFFSSQGVFIGSKILTTNSNPPPFCYDMYRYGNIKNTIVNGRFVISAIDSGDCFSKDHKLLLVIDPITTDILHEISFDGPLHKSTFDNTGNNYYLDSTGTIFINRFWVPRW